MAEVVEIVLCLHYAWLRFGQHRWSAPVISAPGIFLRPYELRPGVLPLVLDLGFGLATSGLVILIMRVFVVVLECSLWLAERASYCQQTSQSCPSRSQLRDLTQNPSLCPHGDSSDWQRRPRWQRRTGGSHWMMDGIVERRSLHLIARSHSFGRPEEPTAGSRRRSRRSWNRSPTEFWNSTPMLMLL